MTDDRGTSHRSRAGAGRPADRGFRSLYFGLAAAENEVAKDPERFRRTYFDRWSLAEKVADHERFLILGPKGAGKSAAAAFVSLKWEAQLGEPSIFAKHVDFDELNRTQSPLTSLDHKLVSGEMNSMTDAAWKLFLSVRLLESLLSDPASSISRDPQAIRLLSDLQEAGLASDDYPKVLRRVRERRALIRVPFGEFGRSSSDTETLSPGQVGDAVLRLILQATTPNRHLLAIDGLDKAISENPAYWQTLAALVRVADTLRREASKISQCHIYVMVMCRSDVFRHTQFADAPKIAADGAVHIEWHAEAADPREVLLWEYLARKAEVDADFLLACLPRSVRVGKQGGAVEALRYVLEFTRYTPRDISQLFNTLQEVAGGHQLSGRFVRAAADRFASNHFLSELIAEAVGLLPSRVVASLDGVLGSLPARKFDLNDLEAGINEEGLADVISARELGEYLFLQGAIGNYDQSSGYVQFYHRRDTYKFKRRGSYILHNAVVYALNVPWNTRQLGD
ncbi:P-loop ATPase, Sll1717 family [Jiangella endophytica]|uniref:P-loop ATPase, Sll1717 family n=1 Tax=Jiangella endophytica TaxID=1623398 RepID=UPI0013008DD0|nr:hypothetical protein [Jiangella endophytica]